MNIDERHRAILKILAESGSISVSRIQTEFLVSYDSAKRDLRILEEKGLLKRTHGGAIALDLPEFSKPTAPEPEVVKTAEYALSLIGEGESVFIPRSDEGRWLAANLPEGVTAVVNSLELAGILSRKRSCIMIGGRLNENGICIGGDAVESVRNLRFDKSFIVTEGIDSEFGVSVKSVEEAAFLRGVIAASRKAVGLYSAGKLGVEASVRVCEADALSCVITDESDIRSVVKLRKVVSTIIVGEESENQSSLLKR